MTTIHSQNKYHWLYKTLPVFGAVLRTRLSINLKKGSIISFLCSLSFSIIVENYLFYQLLHLPKAPYVLTILKESKDVFMACRDDSRFCTTGILRYAIMAANMSSNTRRTQRPIDINGKCECNYFCDLHYERHLKELSKFVSEWNLK